MADADGAVKRIQLASAKWICGEEMFTPITRSSRRPNKLQLCYVAAEI
jgi:hypothetical protein